MLKMTGQLYNEKIRILKYLFILLLVLKDKKPTNKLGHI